MTTRPISQIIADLKATCAPESDVGLLCADWERQHQAISEAAFNCPHCHSHDFGLFHGSAQLRRDIRELRHDLQLANNNAQSFQRACHKLQDENRELQSKLAAHDACLTQVREEMPEVERIRKLWSDCIRLSEERPYEPDQVGHAISKLLSAYDHQCQNEARWRNTRDVWEAERKRLESTCQILRSGQDNMGSVIASHVSDNIELQKQLSASKAACAELRNLLQEIADKDAEAEEDLRALGLDLPEMSEVRKKIAATLAAQSSANAGHSPKQQEQGHE